MCYYLYITYGVRFMSFVVFVKGFSLFFGGFNMKPKNDLIFLIFNIIYEYLTHKC